MNATKFKSLSIGNSFQLNGVKYVKVCPETGYRYNTTIRIDPETTVLIEPKFLLDRYRHPEKSQTYKGRSID